MWIHIIQDQRACSSPARNIVILDLREKFGNKRQGSALCLDFKRFNQYKNCSRGSMSSRFSGEQILREALLVLVLLSETAVKVLLLIDFMC